MSIHQRSGDHQVLLAVYVDDQIIISKSLQQVHQVKKAMSHAFDIKDLRDASYVLGISIIRDRGSRKLQLSQSQYLKEVLIRFKMEECKSISTPMDANQKLFKGTRLGCRIRHHRPTTISAAGRESHVCNGRYKTRSGICCGDLGTAHAGAKETSLASGPESPSVHPINQGSSSHLSSWSRTSR